MRKFELFVNGEATAAADGRTETIVSPATEEVLAEVPVGGAEDVERAVSAAHDAFESWFDRTPGERAGMLLKLADRIEANADELALLEAANVGKPHWLAKSEIPFLVDNLRFFAGAARCMEGKAAGEYLAGYTSFTRREPVGVVASIAPWNYPLMMAIWKIGPALAAGNTVILKPSEQTPLTSLRLAELAADIFPAGVFNVLTGYGEPVGAGLVRHPKVGMVSITGDVGTGKIVARTAAESLKRVHLELGGKAPVVVFDDADLEQVAAVLKLASFANSGQDCTAATRIYGGPKIYDQLLETLAGGRRVGHLGRPRGRQHLHRPGGLEGAAGSRRRVRRPGGGNRAQPRRHRRQARRRQGLLLPADTHRRRPTAGRDRAARGLRPGGDGHAVRERRRGDPLRQRRRLRPRGLGLDEATSAGPSPRRGSSASAPSGSTTTCRSSPRCRTAASSSPATARTCRCTPSRTTPSSST